MLKLSNPLIFPLIFSFLFVAEFAIPTAEGMQLTITSEELTDVDPDTPGDQPGYKVTFVTLRAEGKEGEFGTSSLS